MSEDRKKNPKTIFDLADEPTPNAELVTGMTLEEALAKVTEVYGEDEETTELIRWGYNHKGEKIESKPS
jgi:hypothetical protein